MENKRLTSVAKSRTMLGTACDGTDESVPFPKSTVFFHSLFSRGRGFQASSYEAKYHFALQRWSRRHGAEARFK